MSTLPYVFTQGTGRPLLFLHGVGGDHNYFYPQIQFFGKSGFQVHSWDMPGYGKSPKISPMNFESLASSVVAYLNSQNLATVDLIGHSFGGMIALETAVRFQERFRSLTLSGTSALFGNASGLWQKRFIDERLQPLAAGSTMRELAADLAVKMLGPSPDPDAKPRFLDSMEKLSPAAYRSYLELLVSFNRREDLPGLKLRTLIIAGTEDKVAPLSVMRALNREIAGSEMIEIPGAGHLANLEKPAEFNRALADFLAKAP